jgi:hypothetical protein
MKTVITKSGNFVVATEGYYETAVSRPFLNHCSIEQREKHRKDCEDYNISEYYNQNFLEGEFQGYDYGQVIGINDPYAKEILKSNILLVS